MGAPGLLGPGLGGLIERMEGRIALALHQLRRCALFAGLMPLVTGEGQQGQQYADFDEGERRHHATSVAVTNADAGTAKRVAPDSGSALKYSILSTSKMPAPE